MDRRESRKDRARVRRALLRDEPTEPIASPLDVEEAPAVSRAGGACSRCSTSILPESRYCHLCGIPRTSVELVVRREHGRDEGSRTHTRIKAYERLAEASLAVGLNLEWAEEQLSKAIDMGVKADLPTEDLVSLFVLLGETWLWRGQCEHGGRMVRLAEDGLRRLRASGAPDEDAAAALGSIAALGHRLLGNADQWRQRVHECSSQLIELPYSRQLRLPHILAAEVGMEEGRDEDALDWLRTLASVAEASGDRAAVGHARLTEASLLARQGKGQEAATMFQEALAPCSDAGDVKHEGMCLYLLAEQRLHLGQLRRAKTRAHQAIEIMEEVGHKGYMGLAHWVYGIARYCEGAWQDAAEHYRTAVEMHRETGNTALQARTLVCLGRALLNAGEASEALSCLQEALRLARPQAPTLVCWALAAVEEAVSDDRVFREFVRQADEDGVDEAAHSVQSIPAPSNITQPARRSYYDEFTDSIPDHGWLWEDPMGDCLYQTGGGLDIHVANGRGLWDINLSAPRLTRQVEHADFAVQVVVGCTDRETLSIGGILLWWDAANAARLERGSFGRHDIAFIARQNRRDVAIGRGRLETERTFLRVEKRGTVTQAFCSSDGGEWYLIGATDFAMDGPPTIGLYGQGCIQREIHPGTFPEGTAIRFESFEIWTA